MKTVLISLCVFILLGGGVALFYIPKLRVAEISIGGLSSLNQEDLKEEISGVLNGKFYGIFPYDNILMVPREKITFTLLEKFPLLKSVSVTREFPQSLSVIAEERKAEALCCPGYFSTTTTAVLSESSFVPLGGTTEDRGGCAFVDASGFIFQPAPLFSGTIFLKFFDERDNPPGIGKEMLTEAEFKKLIALKEKLSGKNLAAHKIILENEEIYEIHLDEGWYILINSKNEAEQSFSNLELVLDATIKEKRPELDYVDLRFGKKVLFKLDDSI